ncbi:MAG: cell wall metabolism sensor histidine kinase WalK [Firmicutes bacterium]|nr:cell wall metabolism sensor histidine kinase WalK [Bacillota bacterium]
MVRLVRDLLHLSQLDQGTVRWDIQPYDLPSLVEEALAKLEVTAQRKRLQIHREWPRDLPPVLVDRDKLLQVLLNILANAIEFTPEGGAITVRVGAAEALFPAAVPAGAAGPAAAQGPAGVATAGGARAEAPEPAQEAGRYLAVQVQDTGIGIPKDDLPRIFERFYRVDKARSRTLGGTGLGMAIAKQIVEALGGRIGIDSELGKGTVVTFTVPVALAGDGSGWDGDEAALPEGVGP